MAFFDKIMGQGSNNPNPWIDKAAAQFDAGRYAEAARTLEKAIETDPENVELCYKMGIALTYLGNYTDAEGYTRRFTNAYPDNVSGWHSLGNILYAQRNFAGANECYDRVLSQDQSLLDVWYRKADCLEYIGDFAGAADCCARILQSKDGSAREGGRRIRKGTRHRRHKYRRHD